VGLAAAAAVTATVSQAGGEFTDHTTLLDAFLEHYYRPRPVNATFTGMHGHDHRLPDWSAAGVEAQLAEMRALRSRLAAAGASSLADAAVATRDWTAIDLALADAFLEVQIAELEGRHFQRGNPSLVVGEALFAIVGLMVRETAPLEVRARMVRSRLAALPHFLASALAVVREAPVPSTWADKALGECAGGHALLGEGLDRWCSADAIPLELREALRREGDAALGALAAFRAEVEALSRDTEPARACGSELLALLIRRGHWCDRSIDALLADVRAEFAEESARLEAMARAIDPDGLEGVQRRLAASHPAPEDYLAAFQATWDGCRATSDAHALVTWPEAPIRYVPFPEATRDAAPSLYYLFYRSPAPLAWPAVHDYVVPPIDTLDGEALERHLRAWNHGVIKLNHVVHHGALGHHVQNRKGADAPLMIGRIAAVDCASRIAMFLGGTMAEGWACYATDLMDECGFLTPEERVSEQHSRVRMLARAMVDLEFHAGAISFGEAVTLYVQQVGMPPAAAHNEAVKNSMFPGTALMYWLGTSQIHALRASEQARLGADFSVRHFHDALLSFGAIPVALAARLVPGGAAA
jgi:uncharacterized protein (DUF885 family)